MRDDLKAVCLMLLITLDNFATETVADTRCVTSTGEAEKLPRPVLAGREEPKLFSKGGSAPAPVNCLRKIQQVEGVLHPACVS